MTDMLKILFIDDDERYAIPLIDKAEVQYKINLDYYEDWEEGFSVLEANFDDYQAVIIDGKGKKTKDGPGDDPSHVTQAIIDLNRLRGKECFIPYVILSKFREIKDSMVDMFFEKGKDEDRMFNYLINEIENSPINKLRSKYHKAFEAFGENKLDKAVKANLIEVLTDYENNQWTINSFTPLRKLIEAIYISLHEKDDELIPYECLRFENNKINFRLCELRLRGEDIRNRNHVIVHHKIPSVLPDHISWLLGPITKVCSSASHEIDSSEMTKFTLGTIINGVSDLLVWYNKFVDENY